MWNADKNGDQWSCFGVKIVIDGKVYGERRGVNVLGNINQTPGTVEGATSRKYTTYPFYDHYFPYVKIGKTAEVSCKASGINDDGNGGIYLGGWAVIDIEGHVHGQTGVMAKSGDVVVNDGYVKSDDTDGTSVNGGNYHSTVSGSGIFVVSSDDYAGETNVSISGDSKIEGAKGSAIIDVLGDGAYNTKVTVKDGTNEGAGSTVDVSTLVPNNTEYHTTEVTITDPDDPTQTKVVVVISQGAAPTGDANVAAGHNATSRVNWTGASEDITDDLTLAELIINQSTAQTLTVKAGKTLTSGQVTLGEKAQIVVEPGAKFIVTNKQGIVAPVAENILLKNDENNHSIFLFNPDVESNRHPNATVQVYTNCYQLTQSPAKTYVRQRLAIPVMETGKPANNFSGEVFPGSGASFLTYAWTWDGYKWAAITGWNQLKPFIGYTFSNNSQAAGVTYSFTGELVGNGDAEYNFPTGGFDYFGCSHVAPIYLDSLFKHFASDMEAAVWIYDFSAHQYKTITADDLKDFADVTEIKPMEAFVLNLHAASGKSGMDYASAVWGNPRFDAAIGRPSQKNPAPARSRFNDASNRAIVNITAENGYRDQVKLIEKDQYTAEFENGADANKLMFADGINLYATTEAGELARVATDDLKGTLLSFRAGNSAEYTITLTSVLGEDYALRDNVTGQIITFAEGATYTFMQEANTTVPARFEVIAIAEVATAIENVEEAAKATGIYTITGQYVGRDFTNLPAGAYIVNGVKVIK